MPEFPGGMTGLLKFLENEMRYLQAAQVTGAEGRVIVQVVIEKDGTPAQARILRHLHPELDAEALRIVQQMPKWKPGKQNGTPKRVFFTIPIAFKINR